MMMMPRDEGQWAGSGGNTTADGRGLVNQGEIGVGVTVIIMIVDVMGVWRQQRMKESLVAVCQ